jgi:hypothetical protein
VPGGGNGGAPGPTKGGGKPGMAPPRPPRPRTAPARTAVDTKGNGLYGAAPGGNVARIAWTWSACAVPSACICGNPGPGSYRLFPSLMKYTEFASIAGIRGVVRVASTPVITL